MPGTGRQSGDPSRHRAPCPWQSSSLSHPSAVPHVPGAISIAHLFTPPMLHLSVPCACPVCTPSFPIHPSPRPIYAPPVPPPLLHAPCPVCAPCPSSSPVLRGAFTSFLPQGIKGERGYMGPPGEKGELVSPSGPCCRGQRGWGSPRCPPLSWAPGLRSFQPHPSDPFLPFPGPPWLGRPPRSHGASGRCPP